MSPTSNVVLLKKWFLFMSGFTVSVSPDTVEVSVSGFSDTEVGDWTESEREERERTSPGGRRCGRGESDERDGPAGQEPVGDPEPELAAPAALERELPDVVREAAEPRDPLRGRQERYDSEPAHGEQGRHEADRQREHSLPASGGEQRHREGARQAEQDPQHRVAREAPAVIPGVRTEKRQTGPPALTLGEPEDRREWSAHSEAMAQTRRESGPEEKEPLERFGRV